MCWVVRQDVVLPNTCCIGLMEFEGWGLRVEGDRGTGSSSAPLRGGHGEASGTPASKVRKRRPTAPLAPNWDLLPSGPRFFFLSTELHSSVMTPWARKQRLQTVAEIRKTRQSWVPGTMVCMLISLSYELFPFNPVSKDDFLHMQLIPHITTRNCIFQNSCVIRMNV